VELSALSSASDKIKKLLITLGSTKARGSQELQLSCVGAWPGRQSQAHKANSETPQEARRSSRQELSSEQKHQRERQTGQTGG